MDHRIIPYADEHHGAVSRVAAASLDLPEDVTETEAIVSRLLSPPAGRRAVRLVAVDRDGQADGVLFASRGDEDASVGHLELVAVTKAARRKGIARRLILAAEQRLREYGVREVRIAANASCYAWPGVDVRYTPAMCIALALGYEQERTAWNMTVDLTGIGGTADAEKHLATHGISVRRAWVEDAGMVAGFAAEHFGGNWPWEVRESISRSEAGAVAGCYLAERDNRVLGFAAYGALRPSLFGPMGTAPISRGTGIGSILLRRCLADQHEAGLTSAQIGWAGPIAFYARTVGARIERVFVLYRKALTK